MPFDKKVTSGGGDAEVLNLEIIDARDGEISLGARLDRDIEKANKELDKIKKLEESTVSTVEAESYFTTVEATSGGYFEDVKLEGKTLVNLADKPLYTPNESGWKTALGNLELYKTNTTYTFIGDVTLLEDGVSLYISGETLIKGHNIVTFTTTNPTSSPIELYSVGSPGSFVVDNVIILEGDHTQNPPAYFEGLASVGDGADEIVVESVNENLFDMSSKYEGAMILEDGSKIDTQDWRLHDFIKVKPNETYYLCDDGLNFYQFIVVLYDSNKSFIGRIVRQGDASRVYTMPSNAFYCRINYSVSVNGVPIVRNNIMFNKGTTPKPYAPCQSDKKPLLYYNNETQTWEKPILREWDSIEKHADGKYYYHQRSGEVVLNGSENWGLNAGWSGEEMSTNSYYLTADGQKTAGLMIKSNGTTNIISEVMPTVFINSTSFDGDCVSGENYSSAIYIRINKSKVLNGIKPYLQQNPMRVVYQLAEEKVYECTNIDLITYANETNYIVECGAIVPRTTLKVMSNISNVVRTLQEKVSLLENKFIEMFKLVLSGDVQSLAYNLYPEDFNNIEESDNQENINNIEDTNNQE